MPMPESPNLQPERLSDRGPRYTETPAGDYPFEQWLAEPYNAFTASFFILIVLYWFIRLRGRFGQFPFLTICLPLLFVGGVGGTIYHATRSSSIFFLMDVIPIYLLGAVVAVYLWIRLGPKLKYLFGMIAVLVFLQGLGHLQLPTHWAINLSYASLALIILAPLAIVLVRTQFRHGGWVGTSLACFGLAWFFRLADVWRPPILPMGTHWLWHTFGALTTAALSQYFYLVEREGILKKMPK